MTPIIDSIKELKMEHYLDCLLDNKLSVLGEGTEEALQAAWEKIKLACAEYSETMDYKYYLGTLSEARKLVVKHNALRVSLPYVEEYCRKGLHTLGDPDGAFAALVAGINGLGYDYSFSAETWQRDIRAISAEVKMEQISIEDMERNMNRFSGPGEAPARALYYTNIVHFQKALGIFPTMGPVAVCRQITVYEYITYTKMFNSHIKQRPADNGTGY